MTNPGLPSPELLRKLVGYDPLAGTIIWRARTPDMFTTNYRHTAEMQCAWWNIRFAGAPAFTGQNRKGYLVGKINGRYAAAHRIAWTIMTGAWPTDQVDHINGVRSDNRFANLREVDNSENLRNAKTPRTNSSGRIGVVFTVNGNWQAYARRDRKRIHLGTFATFDAACAARSAAEEDWGYHPNHGRLGSGPA